MILKKKNNDTNKENIIIPNAISIFTKDNKDKIKQMPENTKIIIRFSLLINLTKIKEMHKLS